MSDINLLNGLNSTVSGTYSQSDSKLENTLENKDYSTASDEELMEACKSFEAYFLEQAFKGMEKMIPKSDENTSTGTSYVDMFKDNLYQEYAEKATERGDGIGIAKMLYEQMKRNYSTTVIPEASATADTADTSKNN